MMTHSYPFPRLIACTNTYFLHVYRSISVARMRRYTQLAHLFHQCATSLLSRDGRIADCTVRHPGGERPFSSWYRHASYMTTKIIWHVELGKEARLQTGRGWVYLYSCSCWFVYWRNRITVLFLYRSITPAPLKVAFLYIGL